MWGGVCVGGEESHAFVLLDGEPPFGFSCGRTYAALLMSFKPHGPCDRFFAFKFSTRSGLHAGRGAEVNYRE